MSPCPKPKPTTSRTARRSGTCWPWTTCPRASSTRPGTRWADWSPPRPRSDLIRIGDPWAGSGGRLRLGHTAGLASRRDLGHGSGGQAPVGPGQRPVVGLEHGVGVELALALDQPGHQAGPAGLVGGAEPGSVIAVEVLVEQNEVTPVRVVLEQPGPAVDRPPPVIVTQEGPGEAA